MTCKPLIVGEANPWSPEPKYALYPWPEGSAGCRLMAHLGMSRRAYLDAFRRANLFSTPPEKWKWSAVEARDAAHKLLTTTRPRPQVVIMLGARVAAAFGMGTLPAWGRHNCAEVSYIRIPHPSGRCREWNDKTARVNLRRALGGIISGTL